MACCVAGDDVELLQLLVQRGANLRHQARDGKHGRHLLVSNDFVQVKDGLILFDLVSGLGICCRPS